MGNIWKRDPLPYATSIHVEYFGEKEWDEKRWKLGYNQRLHRCFVHRTPKANSMHCIYGSRDSFLIIIKTPWNSTATATIISGSKYSMTIFREMRMLCSRTFTYSDFYSFSQKFWQLKFDGSDIKKTEYISAQPFSTQVSSLISLQSGPGNQGLGLQMQIQGGQCKGHFDTFPGEGCPGFVIIYDFPTRFPKKMISITFSIYKWLSAAAGL